MFSTLKPLLQSSMYAVHLHVLISRGGNMQTNWPKEKNGLIFFFSFFEVECLKQTWNSVNIAQFIYFNTYICCKPRAI